MKKGDFCVKVLRGAGVETATIQRVESVKKGVIKLENVESLAYSATTLAEIDPVIPGFSSHLIPFDGDEVEYWGFKDKQ